MPLPTRSFLVSLLGEEGGATFYETMMRNKIDIEEQRREIQARESGQGSQFHEGDHYDDVHVLPEPPVRPAYWSSLDEIPDSEYNIPGQGRPPPPHTPCDCDFTYDDIIDEQESLKRKRESDAMFFLTRPLTYGYNSAMNQKYTCIWSCGVRSFTEALTGFMWVAVHGMNSICVATRIADLERELNLRMAMGDNQEPKIQLRRFRNGLISKVEEFVDPTENRQPHPLHQIITKPFGVVSVVPYTKLVRTLTGHEATSAKYDEENAIKFLQYEMKSGAVFTYNKTIETAIRALDHLFHQKFKASEIQVFVLRKKDRGQAKALTHIREDLDIEEHLAPMNNNRDVCVREEDLEKEDILEIEEEQLAAMNSPSEIEEERLAALENRCRCYWHSMG